MFSTLVRHGRFISCQKPDLITGGRGILLCLRIVFRLLQNSQHTGNVCIDADGLFCNGVRAKCLSQIDAGINCFGILISHLSKRIFDNNRGIGSYAHFQKEDVQSRMAARRRQGISVSAPWRFSYSFVPILFCARFPHYHRFYCDRLLRHKL